MAVKTGSITLPWADGEYAFRLGIGELQEIERKTGCGPLELYKRMADGRWRTADLREVIRNGLIGGDMKPADAAPLIKRYVDDRPLMESVPIVQAIMLSALFGPPDENAKKAGAEESPPTSPSADSTRTAQS